MLTILGPDSNRPTFLQRGRESASIKEQNIFGGHVNYVLSTVEIHVSEYLSLFLPFWMGSLNLQIGCKMW